MPRYEVQHSYVRTDVYSVEAEDQVEALRLVRAGEVDDCDKLDFHPESTRVWSVDDNGDHIDLLLTTKNPGDDLLDSIQEALELEGFGHGSDERFRMAETIAKLF